MDLAKLKKINLKEFWKDEAREFTPWLAQEESLELLGNALGLEIELKDTEVQVGKFYADLLAIDINSDRNIIVENQLGKTNHDHLGKIITYASGLDASIIVWICGKVSEEHRNAIDWLNEITDEKIAFFALEIELWKIGNSPLAPKFNVVCSPNEWAKMLKGTSKSLSETKVLQLEFWQTLKEYMEENKTFLRLRTPRAQHWYSIAIGRSYFNLSLTVNTRDKRLGCEIYMRGESAKTAFKKLEKKKKVIETELSEELNWQELPEGQDSRIILYTEGDIKNKERWEEYFSWCKNYAEKFHRVFSKRIKNLKL